MIGYKNVLFLFGADYVILLLLLFLFCDDLLRFFFSTPFVSLPRALHILSGCRKKKLGVDYGLSLEMGP